MLFTELHKGQSVYIGGAKVTIAENRQKVVRLAIDADKSIKVSYERKKKDSARNKQDA